MVLQSKANLKNNSENEDSQLQPISYRAKYSEIYEYLKEFIKADEETRLAVQESVEKVAAIRDYEETLFENRALNTLEGRGAPTFDKLDIQEKVAYIKHTVVNYQDIFQILELHMEEVKQDKTLCRALVEKLALTNHKKDLFYRNNKFLDLSIISSEPYKQLFKISIDHAPNMTFKELTQLLYTLGDLHKREAGQLMPELYSNGTKRLLLVTKTMLDKTNSILRKSDFSDEQKAEIVKELGVGLEGILKLGMFN